MHVISLVCCNRDEPRYEPLTERDSGNRVNAVPESAWADKRAGARTMYVLYVRELPSHRDYVHKIQIIPRRRAAPRRRRILANAATDFAFCSLIARLHANLFARAEAVRGYSFLRNNTIESFSEIRRFLRSVAA